MLLAIGVLGILVVLFALMAAAPLMPEIGPAETTLSENQVQPVVAFPADQAQAA